MRLQKLKTKLKELMKQMKIERKSSKHLKPLVITLKYSSYRNKKSEGKTSSNPQELKKVLAREYKDRLRQRPIRQDLLAMRNRRKKIFLLKMKLSGKRRTPDWNMTQLERALKDLKNNKSRDFEGYVNEIFKADVIGEDLKMSLLVMFNKMKRKKLIAKFMNFSNISTVHKKGSKILLENERGIFRVSVIRSILMRLIYNTNYSKLDRKYVRLSNGG